MSTVYLMEFGNYREIIEDELERRKEINPSYSQRAFARDLGLSSSRLSQIMSRSKGLSVEAATQIVEKLQLGPDLKNWFIQSVGSEHARSPKEKEKFKERVLKIKQESETFKNLNLEFFRVISNWYHYAILELTRVSDFKNDTKWIAETLGIDPKEVKSAIDRLIHLDLLEVSDDGSLLDRFQYISTPNDISSQSIKKFNSQMIRKAGESLVNDSVDDREISSNLMAIHKKDLPLFKEEIRNFRRNIDKIKTRKKSTSVYCLGIQFFELTNHNIRSK